MKKIGFIAAAWLLALQPAVVVASAPSEASAAYFCASGYYQNSRGRCVRRPHRTPHNQVPAGASAQCRDGTYSFSQSRRGTCSHHGGVRRWL